MIKLLDQKDFEVKIDVNGEIRDIVLTNFLDSIIRKKLVIASEKHELIYTYELRGIGKTYSLIKFAKLHNYSVIVNSIGIAEQLRKHYKFPYIYSQQQAFNKELSDKNILVDEGVDFKRINDEGYYNIITGFSHRYIDENIKKEPTKSIKEQVIENLEEEIKSLSKIIVKTRENKEYGTYKNLIISLKEVLELYNQETGQNNNIINTNVSLNLNDLIKLDSDGNMEIIKCSVNQLPNIKEITENVLKELKDQLDKRGLSR